MIDFIKEDHKKYMELLYDFEELGTNKDYRILEEISFNITFDDSMDTFDIIDTECILSSMAHTQPNISVLCNDSYLRIRFEDPSIILHKNYNVVRIIKKYLYREIPYSITLRLNKIVLKSHVPYNLLYQMR